MKANFKRPFQDFVKKQHKALQLAIKSAVDEICLDPGIGEQKKGDLLEIWVYKFTHKKQQYLIAYRPPGAEAEKASIEMLVIDFYQVGSHENFYDDLKKYMKS